MNIIKIATKKINIKFYHTPNIALCFLVYINFFIIYSKAGMVVINSLLMHKLGLEK